MKQLEKLTGHTFSILYLLSVVKGHLPYFMRKCFACDKKLGKNPTIVDTRDGQIVFVGSECFKLIRRSGETGYQPPLGGPRLWRIPKKLSQQELNRLYLSAKTKT